MTQAHWAIRFYLPFEEDKSIEFIGNFENAGKRFLDDIVVFSGIYGIPDYMLWYIHKDMVAYNFSSYSIELKLFLTGDPESCYFQDNYRIMDIGDDFKSDRKLLYAIQEDYTKLDVLLIDADISTLDYKETRTVEQLLIEVLEDTGIFPVVFCEHSDPLLQSIKFEYPSFTIEPSWTVRDFIQYIAEENGFEWTIKHGILFIGPELHTYKKMKASKEYLNRQIDNIQKNYWNMKLSWGGSPLDVLYYYELIDEEKLTDMRCVWAKHWAGAKGDITKGCFVPVGKSINKIQFIETLEGAKEITNAYHYLFRVPKHHQLRVGGIMADTGENEYIEEVSIQKDVFQYTKKTPRKMVIEKQNPLFTLNKIGRTTPYMDHEAGLFFPSVQDPMKCPNSLIFSPNDRIEQAVVGPFVYGNGSSSFGIPFKEPEELRLTLPMIGTTPGPTLFIYKDGELIYQPQYFPLDNNVVADKPYIQFMADGTFFVYIDADNAIKIDAQSENIDITCNKRVFIYGKDEIIIQNENHNKIHLYNNGDILIDSTGKINIDATGDAEITCLNAKIAASVKAEVDAVTVDIGPTATMVNLAGGAQFLSYATHTHVVPVGPAIPGPPATAIIHSGAATTKTKAT